MATIQITLEELKNLLDKQRENTINKLLSHNYIYNKESSENIAKTLPIDEEKFRSWGSKSEYPNDFIILKKYLKD